MVFTKQTWMTQCSSQRKRIALFYLKGAKSEATLRENEEKQTAIMVSRYNKYRFGCELLIDIVLQLDKFGQAKVIGYVQVNILCYWKTSLLIRRQQR